ncbi:MAG: nitrogenase molybdenum-iron protein NifN [Clostridiales bacterium]|nr:nitrogenase molybdenum-iron protein NifN [Clostridiales bacterium]
MRDVNQNPCNMCMPMGGIFAFKGVEGSMLIIHGSQGCSTYMRRHMAEHFNEPIDVASSSLNEKGTVYGGETNLKKGLDNVITLYQPRLIGVLTTCLAETIGEDIDRIASQYMEEKSLTDFNIIAASTPGYGGSHAEGYFRTARKIIESLAYKTEKHSKINIIVPIISPADIREIKRILNALDIEYVIFPDYSDTLDQPFARPYNKNPDGGTKLQDIASMAGAAATIQMGITVDDAISPGRYLEQQFGIPLYNLPIPIGVEATDRFIDILVRITGCVVPDSLKQERGRLIDAMIDAHKHNFEARCTIFGDPENVYAVAKMCMENGIVPAVAATGSPSPKLGQALGDHPHICVLTESDFMQILEKSTEENVDFAIGGSDGKFLSDEGNIPLIRYGFPIHDRIGGQRLLSVGYTGTTLLLDRMTNTLLSIKYDNYRNKMRQRYLADMQR